MAVEIPLDALKEIAGSIFVTKIWYDQPVSMMVDEKVPDLNDPASHNYDYTGKGVVVAVLDTGVFPHEDLTTPHNRILAC